MIRCFVLLSTQSGRRSRKHLFLKQVALPVCVPERAFVAFRSAKERSTLFFLLRSICPRASSGSRTRTSAMARRQAAATSWVHKTSGLYAVRKTNPNNWLCTPAEPHQQYPLQSHLCKKCFRVVIFKDQSVGVLPHQREHRARFELASPPYQGGILAARRPMHFLNVFVCIVNS